MDRLILGIDIGGTKSAVVLGDDAGNVLQREQIATVDVATTLRQLTDRARTLAAGHAISACGICCGGPVSSRDGLVLSPPNLPGWDRVPVVKHFSDALGVPAALENDANALAVAEWQWGLNRQVDDLVYLTCGTGQGAGLILGGRLHRGRQDLAGEVGHVRLLPLGPVGFHKAGSVEGLTSGGGMAELAKLRLREPHGPSVLDGVVVDAKAVGEAAVAGDAVARKIVAESADYLGQLCAILIDVLNPQRISLGSMAWRLGDLLLDGVRAAARREALPAGFDGCVIDRSVLGDRAQDLAALAVAPRK